MTDSRQASGTACERPLGLNECSPERYGKLGMIFCPHGCVTQCERARRGGATNREAQAPLPASVGAKPELTPRGLMDDVTREYQSTRIGGEIMDARGCAIRASFDPGLFTPRGDNYDEPLHRWQARAVLIALERAGHRIIEADGCLKTEDRREPPSGRGRA